MTPFSASARGAVSPRLLFLLGLVCLIAGAFTARAQQQAVDRFAQLREAMPSPSTYRTASGAPGHEYWQQTVS